MILHFKLQPPHFKHPTHPSINLELQVDFPRKSASLAHPANAGRGTIGGLRRLQLMFVF